MAAQAALIEETIIGLKKALRRENECKFSAEENIHFGPCFWPFADLLSVTDTGPDEAITQPTNRGNKLRVNARYVHEGALGFSNPRDFYKQVRFHVHPARVNQRAFCKTLRTLSVWHEFWTTKKIEHAGYTRYILHRNPPRYDSEGEEIDGDEEPDTEAEAEAAEDNPFAGIALERKSF